MVNDYDAIIIGAGPSGLSAGIRLAQFGRKVCLLEQHHSVGGLNSFYKKSNRWFEVGLHAFTNFAKPEDRHLPLTKVMRQLRIPIHALELVEQKQSQIHFPDATLVFSNGNQDLFKSIERYFPEEKKSFQHLCQQIQNHDESDINFGSVSARGRVSQIIQSPILVDMLFCPLMFYGSATENDMDWNQFVIMWKAIFIQGFCRPRFTIKHFFEILMATYQNLQGELRLRAKAVSIRATNNQVVVQLDNGNILTAKKVLSCAGYPETLQLLGKQNINNVPKGQMSFVETIWMLDTLPSAIGMDKTIIFFSTHNRFNYRASQDLVDYSSGVVCSPNNFVSLNSSMEGCVRITNIANYHRWKAVMEQSQDFYQEQKEKVIETQKQLLHQYIPQLSRHITMVESFTPLTIERFTSRHNGAIYGCPKKHITGNIGEPNVFVCGTDQGYLGIVGSMMSGIVMANEHVLKST